MASKNKKSDGGTPSVGNQGPQQGGTDQGTSNFQFQINGQYIKDFSFKVPDPIKTFQPSDQTPEIKVSIDVNGRDMGKNVYEVILAVQIQAKKGSITAYTLELAYAGIFTLKDLPTHLLQPMLLIQCPQFLFPFVRQIITQTTMSGGFQPFVLAPLDFGALYQTKISQSKLSAAGQSK